MFEIVMPWPFPKKYGAGTIPGIVILWPREFLDALTEEERFFVRSHEIGHARNLGLLRKPYFLDAFLSGGPVHSLMFYLMRRIPTKQNVEYRKRVREAWIEWEAAADFYALQHGGKESAMYSAFEKTGTPTSETRLEASRRAVARFKEGIEN